MKIPAEHALNIFGAEIEDFVYRKMAENGVSAGFIEKILEGILCQVRKLKLHDLEKFILEISAQIPEICEEKLEKQTAKIEDLEIEKIGNI